MSNDEKTTSITDIIIEGDTLEDAMEKACKVLKTTKANLDYEVLERGGKDGFLGLGKKKPFRVHFIKKVIEKAKKSGLFRVRVRKSGVFLKVTPPDQGGKNISFSEVEDELLKRSIKAYEREKIMAEVDSPTGEWIKIGEYFFNPDFDGRIDIEVSPDEIEATGFLEPPKLYGRELEEEEIIKILQDKGVTKGILYNEITSIIEEGIYNKPVVIARGIPPVKGEDAKVLYNFETEVSGPKFDIDESGKVNYFSDLGLIQNVVAGQVLAKKIPAKKGQPGETLSGKEIPPIDGNDVPFTPGKNTKLSEDGLEIISEISGRALIEENAITVEPIYEIKGDVGLKTGNIIFLGDVIISGNVEDGLQVKAAGNIQVGGTIGKAEIEAGGDVIVRQGILGKDGAVIKAGNNVFANYIEHTQVIAGNEVIVDQIILHSFVDARKIVCYGKSGKIVGGRMRVIEEVNAKVIGSSAEAETRIEAGIDPAAREKLQKYEKEREVTQESLDKLMVNLGTLLNQKKVVAKLSDEKEAMLTRMIKAKKELETQLSDLDADIESIRNHLANLNAQGRISAMDTVHVGVELIIRNAILKTKNPFTYVTFIYDNGYIRPTPYVGIKEDKKKKRR